MKTSFGKKIAMFILAATAAACSLAMVGCNRRVSPFHRHEYVYKYNNDATCGQDGTQTGKCKYCEKTKTVVKEGTATGEHDFDRYFCTVCGDYSPSAPVTNGLAFTKFGDSYEVDGIGSAMGSEILIPSKYNGLPVTSIGWRAFENCGGITKVIIPPTVTSIDVSAFYECDNLREVVIPDSVTEIKMSAFDGCTSLQSITLPKNLTAIESSVFWKCSSLTSIVIPDSVTTIGMSAFYNCTGLSSIVIPSSVTKVESRAFSSCTNLIGVTIPKSVTTMGEDVFYDCERVSVYCEAPSMPAGWDSKWNYLGHQWIGSSFVDAYCPVIWGYNV